MSITAIVVLTAPSLRRDYAFRYLASVSRYLTPAMAKVYIVSFRANDDRRQSKFIVLVDNRKEAIEMAWEHGGPDFQSRFDKSTGARSGNERGSATGFVMETGNEHR